MTVRMHPFPPVLVLAAVFCLAVVSFGHAMPPLDPANMPVAPDYALDESWLAKPEAATLPVDVFFVYPTVLFNDSDWIMDTSDPAMRDAAQTALDTQAVVFQGQANIYAPMYRQMNIASLGLNEEDATPLREIVHSDVLRALVRYLKHENNGRPFFLAGHSQGSMILTDLMLEHWGSLGAEERLVAALLLGWSLTSQNLMDNSALVMCGRADQTGCVISYNAMAAGKQSVAPTLLPGALAVNPLSWTTDGTLAPAEKNLGAVFFDEQGLPTVYPQFTSARIVDGGLIVQPRNVDLVTVEGGHFPAGVYHAFDYALFFENLKANIAERIKAFGR